MTAPSAKPGAARDGLGARERLLLTAERLIAERGMHVSLRDIARAAGQRNNSAVNYHFGGRDGLIESLIAFRMGQLEGARLEALAALETDEARDPVDGLVRVLVEPMFELSKRPDAAHYTRCLEVLRAHPAVWAEGEDEERRSVAIRLVTGRLVRELDMVPRARRTARLRAMTTAMFGLLADHEAVFASASCVTSRELRAREDVVRMLVALVTAPAAT